MNECGELTDVTLRFAGSLGDVMRGIFGPETRKPGIVL